MWKQRLEAARANTDALFGLLQPGAIYDRPVSQRHRLIFYLGHLDTFDWNVACRYDLGMESFHAGFDRLFEAGIDPEPGCEPSDTPGDWPHLDEVEAYRMEIRRRMDEALPRISDYFLNVALEHRYMHSETLSYLLNNLGYDRKRGVTDSVDAGPVPEGRMVEIAAGAATLGQAEGCFGWDNEFRRHRVEVPAFRVSKYKVTNGEYLRFVEAGAAAPQFWVKQGGEWFWRGMFGFIPLPMNWPVYVTQEEAVAYLAWSGKSLMTESQFHRAAYGDALEPQAVEGGNFDFQRWEPCAVDAHDSLVSPEAPSQMVGNGWEWTSTPFSPFEGFQAYPHYPTYSANFFDNAHFVIKGASPRTAACFLRPSFRNWFRPNYPYVYATFRAIEN